MLHFHSNLLLIASESRLIYNLIMAIEAPRSHGLIEQQAQEGRPYWFQLWISNNPKEIRSAYQRLRLGIGENVVTFVNSANPNSVVLKVLSSSGQSEILNMEKDEDKKFGDALIHLQTIKEHSTSFMIFSPEPIKYPAI